MELIPVDHDPFAAAPQPYTGANLGPLAAPEGAAAADPRAQSRLVPVEHDPFSETSLRQTTGRQEAADAQLQAAQAGADIGPFGRGLGEALFNFVSHPITNLIDQAKNAPPAGSRREDYTDIPGDAQPGQGLVDAATSTALGQMGGGWTGAATKAGETLLGAGPIRKTKPVEKVAEPADLGELLRPPVEGLRISPRLPTGVKAPENALANDRLQIDMEAMKRDPQFFEDHVNLLRDYPNVTAAQTKLDPHELTEGFIEHAKDNLLHLHDLVPADTRPRSSLWYDGGNKIAHDFAKEYGAHPASSAASIAALSPQKDWFMNVDLARRVHDIHFNKRDVPYSKEMETTSRRIYADPKFKPMMREIRGKTYGQLEDPLSKAAWLRLGDEAHNPRSHRLVTPEGNFGDPVLTQKGVPSGTGWGSLGEIAKSISALEANGDVAKISGLMGERHKVRSFYNNIIEPNSPHGDVTMDTHAVAASLLRPLSGNSLEVAHNFNNYAGKGLPNARGSATTGVQGTYPFYAEAYRRAAAERNILPRQMQSITWEAVRGLFPDTFKTPKNIAVVNDIWHQYKKGVISVDDARKQIFDFAGGVRPPDWYGR